MSIFRILLVLILTLIVLTTLMFLDVISVPSWTDWLVLGLLIFFVIIFFNKLVGTVIGPFKQAYQKVMGIASTTGEYATAVGEYATNAYNTGSQYVSDTYNTTVDTISDIPRSAKSGLLKTGTTLSGVDYSSDTLAPAYVTLATSDEAAREAQEAREFQSQVDQNNPDQFLNNYQQYNFDGSPVYF